MRAEGGYRSFSLKPKYKFRNDVTQTQLSVGLTKATLPHGFHTQANLASPQRLKSVFASGIDTSTNAE
jgi:hypothetical protein